MGSFIRRATLTGIATGSALLMSLVPASASPIVATPPAQAATSGSALQTLINQDRAANGLGSLTWSDCLASVAQQNAQRIADQGYLSHTTGPSVDLTCGIGATSAGENIAYISSGIDDNQVNTMYMNSPGHRANILGSYNYVATAWVVAPNGYGYNAEEFLNASGLIGGNPVAGAWSSVGGPIGSGPAASNPATGHVQAFVRGTDNQLWSRAYDGASWGGWQALGGVLSAAPAAVFSGGRTHVFIRGSDMQLWHRSFDGISWSSWEPLGGVLASGPTAASWAAGRLDIFARGTDGHLWQRTYASGAWQNWSNSAGSGGVLGSEPAAVSWGLNRLDVFIRGTDLQLWHLGFNGSTWSGWEPLGGVLGSGPAAATGSLGHLDVFVRGTDGQLWQRAWTGAAWTSWTNGNAKGAVFNDAPGVVSMSNGSIEILVRGTDSALWQSSVAAS